MTDLSPEAQAIVDAFHRELPPNYEAGGLPSALRELVKQLKYYGITEKNILELANELEQI